MLGNTQDTLCVYHTGRLVPYITQDTLCRVSHNTLYVVCDVGNMGEKTVSI